MDNELIPRQPTEVGRPDILNRMLEMIRPVWRGRSLIERVVRLLPVDPSSACQRLFNASIHDLREKVKVAGIDIAIEAAKLNKLPPIEKPEDIDAYSTAKLIELCYKMGLLNRPEWRKMTRVYEIRRDLEHEDAEYEAGLEDCFYIFKTCIEIVLSKDPIQLLRVTDVKDVVEKPSAIVATEELLLDYKHTPQTRKKDILMFLISAALDESNPDIVRQNSFEFLKELEELTEPAVKIEIAGHIQERIGRRRQLDLLHAKVAFACGALPYLKQAIVKDFFIEYYKKLQKVGYRWDKYKEHGPFLEELEDIGGLEYCPTEVRPYILKWMVLAYIGERGGYGYYGSNRPVFYSNTAAPMIDRIIRKIGTVAIEGFQQLSDDKDIKAAISNKNVARRFERLMDIAENIESE